MSSFYISCLKVSSIRNLYPLVKHYILSQQTRDICPVYWVICHIGGQVFLIAAGQSHVPL